MSILEKLKETVGTTLGLMMAVPTAIAELRLNPEQIEIFCDNTPNGSELWEAFTKRRDDPAADKDYDFISYVKEVLDEAKAKSASVTPATPSEDKPKTFRDMSDSEMVDATRSIIRTSSTEAEVKRRLKEELQYPYHIAITSHNPTDKVGREAKAISAGLGGLSLLDGSMVMVMMHGKSGQALRV